MSTVMGAAESCDRIACRISLSIAPARIVTDDAPPTTLPPVTVNGNSMSNGAPDGATARNLPEPTACKMTWR